MGRGGKPLNSDKVFMGFYEQIYKKLKISCT